jgi:hypothetical protein
MERRLHTRHRARTTVYIVLPGNVRKGQQVELAFAIDLGAVTKLHRRSAVVAHISGGGTGLMMDAYAAR